MSGKRSLVVQFLGLLGFLALTAAAAGIGSWATIPNIDSWYAQVRKPSWTPPNWVFGPAWTTLYLLMSVAAWRVWRRVDADPEARKNALGCWLFQLLLNAAWSWLFFGMHDTGLAFVELISMWLVILATLVAFVRIDRVAAVLMAPYLLWVTYAGSLNGAIFWLNR
ncbi:TspO/MBR family protein [Paludisphaera mucosa]|uniref:Tryptophan-rich sensory protein n=1 Tax=Paludisphaera mucosa TaxID=3030827 RepID=A0ABT6F725_9BACT|nr:tryptophan-rich sensory protein [Paludisphaera mucosa]